MKILDSHLHLWDPGVLQYDWLRDIPALNRPFLPEQLVEAAQSPDAAIVVQADCAPQQALQEVEWINQQAETSPIKLSGIVAWAPLETGNAVVPYLRHLHELPRVVGIRRSLQNEPLELFYHSDYRDGLLAAAREGFVLDMCVRASQLTALHDLLTWLYQCAPDAQVVLDHMGKPDIADNQWQTWLDTFITLAAFPHVACKISGLPTEADWKSWQPEQLRPWIQQAITAFGPQRCLFGGDWPVVELAGGYPRWRACVMEAIAHLSSEDINAVMGENARNIYLAQSEGGNK